MLIAALCLNILILCPVVAGLLTNSNAMTDAFGPVTDARLILTAVYAAIALASVVLILAHATQLTWAVPATVGLFAFQISYKLFTVALVGLPSPVVATNLFVVNVQLGVIGAVWLRSAPG